MIIIPLQSGSNGNCYYIESGNTALLIDAGITGAKVQQRLALHGRNLRNVQGILISHDHGDHTRCMGSLHRKFDLPIYVTDATLFQIQKFQKIGELNQVRKFQTGASIAVGSITVHTIATTHDSIDGVVFVIDDKVHRVGIFSDLGSPFDELRDWLPTLDGVVIESNYDEAMLANGPYPEHLKRRITGLGGHISNRESAFLLKEHASQRLQWACLCHLSDKNNDPNLAIKTHQDILGNHLPLHIAWRDQVGDLLGFQKSFEYNTGRPLASSPMV